MNGKQDHPLVSIFCLAYNHRDYIEQAIEGFLMQKTDFEYEIVIGEDCSTDGTREIVFEYASKYPEIIRVVTSDTNVGMVENAHRTKLAIRGKYTAICEGDDYWIDPYKLKKQVDFLESNPDYGLVHTDNSRLFETTGEVLKSHKQSYYPNPPSGEVFEKLLRKNFISTLTVVVNTKLSLEASQNLKNTIDNDLMIDYSFWLEISTKTKIKYINDITAVYRVSAGTASRPTDENSKRDWLKKNERIQDFFMKRYNINNEIVQVVLNERILKQLRIQYQKTKFLKEFETPVYSFRPENFKDQVLMFLYKNKLPRFTYLLVEMPSLILRRSNDILGKITTRR